MATAIVRAIVCCAASVIVHLYNLHTAQYGMDLMPVNRRRGNLFQEQTWLNSDMLVVLADFGDSNSWFENATCDIKTAAITGMY